MIQQNPHLLSFDASTWAAIISALAAIMALAFAYWSIRISKHALVLAELQNQSRKPSLAIYLTRGFYKIVGGGHHRIYAFLISINNTSEADNSIVNLDLNLILLTRSGSQITLKIPANGKLREKFNNDAAYLEVPLRIDAHQCTTGWCYFMVNKGILDGSDIDGYQITLTDTHGYRVSIETSIVTQFVSQNDIH